jgi:hypothetical protein
MYVRTNTAIPPGPDELLRNANKSGRKEINPIATASVTG